MEIDLGECRLRRWRPGDEAALAKYAANRNIWTNLTDNFPHPYTFKDAEEWIERNKNQNPVTHFAIATPVEAIGSIGLHRREDISNFRLSAEIGYWIAEPWWGKGIATRAVRAVTEYGFTKLGLVRIFAQVFEWNPASARVLEKAGFTLEARMRKAVIKDGKIIDSFLYAKVRDGI